MSHNVTHLQILSSERKRDNYSFVKQRNCQKEKIEVFKDISRIRDNQWRLLKILIVCMVFTEDTYVMLHYKEVRTLLEAYINIHDLRHSIG